jgi:cysteine desulfurase / selenocysteine lyase
MFGTKNTHKVSVFNVVKIRKDFPILSRKIYGKPLVYFDNGATTQKPKIVIETINELHAKHNSNVHRGVHYLSEQLTIKYESAREKIRNFLNAQHAAEIIFTAGTTASINLAAFCFGEAYIKEGDEIIVSEMEHHSNIVPWQFICQRKGAKLRVIPFNDKGELLMDEYKKLINSKTKLVAVVHTSNSLGTVNPVKEIVAIAHQNNIPVLIDGTQAIQHGKTDVQDLDCDFYAFSGHKIYGPTGIGVLYGKEKYLKEMPPYQGGGDMIDRVTMEKTTYAELPNKFEAGTPNYIGAIGLGAALDYLSNLGLENIANREKKLLDYATNKLAEVKGLKIYGTAKNKSCILSFLIDGMHPYDVGIYLDRMGIAVRTGHHCTHPLWAHFKTEGSVRASLSFYNTFAEINYLCEKLKELGKNIEKNRVALKTKVLINSRAAQEKIIKDFRPYSQWTDKYAELVKLGKKLPPLNSELKTEDNLIRGCQVNTWYHSSFADGKMFFQVDSVSLIIKGFVALLLEVFSGRKPKDIVDTDLYFFDKIGLKENFSPLRANSLWKLVGRMKADAASHLEKSDK